MENPIKTIQEKVNGMKEDYVTGWIPFRQGWDWKSCSSCSACLPSVAFYMIGSAIINFGNGKTSNIEVEHIEV